MKTHNQASKLPRAKTLRRRKPAKPTGRRYGSVQALMRGEGVSQKVQDKVAALEAADKEAT